MCTWHSLSCFRGRSLNWRYIAIACLRPVELLRGQDFESYIALAWRDRRSLDPWRSRERPLGESFIAAAVSRIVCGGEHNLQIQQNLSRFHIRTGCQGSSEQRRDVSGVASSYSVFVGANCPYDASCETGIFAYDGFY